MTCWVMDLQAILGAMLIWDEAPLVGDVFGGLSKRASVHSRRPGSMRRSGATHVDAAERSRWYLELGKKFTTPLDCFAVDRLTLLDPATGW